MLEIQPRLVGGCVILVGDAEVTPATPHLFALLLVLVIGECDPWTRPALQDLLFPGVAGSGHRLRQLLYRLRATGVVLQEGDGPLRVQNPVGDPLGPSADARDFGSLRVLPHYSPRLSAPFLDWLETARDSLQRRLHERELARLRAARERHDWETTSSIALALQLRDPMSEEIASAAAESQAMLGNRDAALDVIDRFVRESGEPLTTRPSLQRLRTRIVAARPLQRDGTLRGRQECLAVLADQWERAVSGGGRACIVFGPAGMGKTRVGETFAAAVRLNAGKVLSYRCDEQNRRSPLALFSLIVRDLRQMRGSIAASPALRSALDDLAPESIVVPTPVTDSDGRRELSLHEDGRRFGSHDTVVEELWHYHNARNEHEVASHLLCKYFPARREVGPIDASLWLSTARDSAWHEFPGTPTFAASACRSEGSLSTHAARMMSRSANRRSEPSATTALGFSVPGPQSMTP
jgi:hypothetical protein